MAVGHIKDCFGNNKLDYKVDRFLWLCNFFVDHCPCNDESSDEKVTENLIYLNWKKTKAFGKGIVCFLQKWHSNNKSDSFNGWSKFVVPIIGVWFDKVKSQVVKITSYKIRCTESDEKLKLQNHWKEEGDEHYKLQLPIIRLQVLTATN